MKKEKKAFALYADLIEELTLRDAIVFSLLLKMIKDNRREGINRYEGRYWVNNFQSVFCDFLPNITVRTLKRSIEKLVNKRYVDRMMFPNNPVGARWWFTIGERGERLLGEHGYFPRLKDKEEH